MHISDIIEKYRGKLDRLDLELLLAHSLGQTREFVLMHPEYTISKRQETIIKKLIQRRVAGEPIAYILGHKEFYGLDFAVNKHTLVPRPETELLVDLALDELRSMLRNKLRNTIVVDIGTGSGNVIVSLTHSLLKNQNRRLRITDCRFFGIDISKEALTAAKKNARIHSVEKKIKFLPGDLLSPIIRNSKFEIRNSGIIVLANLPYLSSEIYRNAPKDVKKFEPKSALYSPAAGLSHYKKLLSQIKNLLIIDHCSLIIFLEFSPEQKPFLQTLIKNILPDAKIKFHKDLAGKWRVCEIKIKMPASPAGEQKSKCQRNARNKNIIYCLELFCIFVYSYICT